MIPSTREDARPPRRIHSRWSGPERTASLDAIDTTAFNKRQPSFLVRHEPRPSLSLSLTFPPRPNPMDTQVMGNPCTKFVVPSTGSTIQVGASVRAGMVPTSALDSCRSGSAEPTVKPEATEQRRKSFFKS